MSGKKGMKKYPMELREQVVQRIRDGKRIIAGFSLAHRKDVRPKFKYQVIYRHRTEYKISVMCRFFGVSRSGYYDYVKRLGQAAPDASFQPFDAASRPVHALRIFPRPYAVAISQQTAF